MSPSTIAIVDDHLLLAEVLRAALTTDPAVHAVVVPLTHQVALLPRLLDLHPDLVLLDLDLGPIGDGTVLIRPLTAAGIKVLVVSGLTDSVRLALALEQGAIGIHRKATGFDALVATARRAVAAPGPLDPESDRALAAMLRAERANGSSAWERLRSLTDREAAVLRALGEGVTVAEMARTWVLSEATVRTHVQSVLRKLDAPSQLQAVLIALRAGWLSAARTALPRPEHSA